MITSAGIKVANKISDRSATSADFDSLPLPEKVRLKSLQNALGGIEGTLRTIAVRNFLKSQSGKIDAW